MSSPMKMDAMRVVDMTIQLVPVLLASALLLASIYEIIMGGLSSFTAFTWPFIGVLSVSSVTVILYTSFYLYTFYQLDYLLPHVRVVTTLAYTVLGMAFTSLTFSTTFTSATIYSCMFFIICVLLWSYNKRNRFLKISFKFVAAMLIYAVALILLSISSVPVLPTGDVYRRPQLIKFLGVWLWSFVYQKRGGLS